MATSRRRKGSSRASPTNSPATASVDRAGNGIEPARRPRVEQDERSQRRISPVFLEPRRRNLESPPGLAYGMARFRRRTLSSARAEPAREVHGATAFATAAANTTTESLSGRLGPVSP